jgi:hypothetical protein
MERARMSHDEAATVPIEADDGVDITLIRWMLGLSPEERLQALNDAANSLLDLQEAAHED